MRTQDTPSHPIAQEIPRLLEALMTDAFPSELSGRNVSLPGIATRPSSWTGACLPPRPTITKARQDFNTRSSDLYF